MTRKVTDAQGRWRSKTVSFRMPPGENALLDSYARLSGMTKQDYIIARLLQKEIVVHGNPRVYKALKDRMDAVLNELQRLNAGDHPSPETLEEIGLMTNMMKEMKNGD